MENEQTYILNELLHKGKRYLIYHGVREVDNKSVIIKSLLEEGGDGPAAEQLRNEYEIYQRLNVEKVDCVLQAYGFELVNHRLSIVLEDVMGQTINKLHLTGIKNLQSFLKLAIDLAKCVGDLHRQHLIHKDINPANILISNLNGQIKIIDFGISTFLSREKPYVTDLEGMEGTIAYISPEQTGRINRFVDFRSDIYSLGVILYEMLIGRLPFETEDLFQLIHLHIAQEAVPPSQIDSSIPQVVSNIIMKCLAKDAENRYLSAYSLKNDLETCLKELNTHQVISSFAIAPNDLIDRFHIPQKLYGRANEAHRLVEIYHQICEGEGQVLFVSGYAGIGKSSLVWEMQRPIEQQGGYFISAKYHQYEISTPFSAILEAFKKVVQLLLTEPPDRLSIWKNRFLDGLGIHLPVLVNLIPELSLITGNKHVELHSEQENKSLINYVLLTFVELFQQTNHPFILFLDDLQWADLLSLRFLKLLSNRNYKHFLLIGAYRDNEITPSHPLSITIKEIKQTWRIVNSMSIQPLDLAAVKEFVEDIVPHFVQSNELAELVYQKTKGNPFSMVQLFKLMNAKQWIHFDPLKLVWSVDLALLAQLQVSDHVADILSQRLHSLPSETQALLRIASILGYRFRVDLLVEISGYSKAQVEKCLQSACHEEFVLKISSNAYQFQHAHLLQAFYQQLDEKERSKLHYQIGEMFLKMMAPQELDQEIITVVNHMNHYLGRIQSEEERVKFAQLNFRAGIKAKGSTAYPLAVEYLTIAKNLLPPHHWTNHYELSLNLYKQLASCEQRMSHEEVAVELYDTAIMHARTPLEKADLYKAKIEFYMFALRGLEGIKELQKALKLFNIHLRFKPSLFSLTYQFLKFKASLWFKGVEAIKKAPYNAEREMVQDLVFRAILLGTLIGDPRLPITCILYLLNSAFTYGSTRFNAYAFISLSCFYGSESVRQYKTAYHWAQTALKLGRDYPGTRQLVGLEFSYYGFISSMVEPIVNTLEPLKRLFHESLRVNSNLFVICRSVLAKNLFSTGLNLGEVENECLHFLEEIKKYSKSTIGLLDLMEEIKLCTKLRGLVSTPETRKQEEEMAKLQENCLTGEEEKLAVRFFSSWTSVYYDYLFGRYYEVLLNCAEFTPHRSKWPGLDVWKQLYYYQALSLAGLNNSSEAKKLCWESLDQSLKRVRGWADAAPENYGHMYSLLTGEVSRVKGHLAEACHFYDQSIGQAQRNGYIQDQALASELAGKFHLSCGNKKMASFYLQEATSHYSTWGAHAKVQELAGHYPELLQSKPFFTTVLPDEQEEPPSKNAKATAAMRGGVEVTALIQSSQTLAGEVAFDKLMSKIMKIILTQSSANKVCLILSKGDQLVVTAEFLPGQTEARILSDIPLERKQGDLCQAVVLYVARSRKEILLNLPYEEGLFVNNPYIKQTRPQSVLCLPLINQGKLIGLLYLENTISINAFPPSHVQLLAHIANQIAISIENACLYANLEKESNERNEKITQMQNQLIEQEKILSLGLLVAGVAHEVKNPLNFVINFASLSSELLLEIKQLIIKYEASYKPEEREEFAELLSILEKNISTVEQQGRRADRILQTMQAHSRLSQEEKVLIDVNLLVDEYLTLSYKSIHRQYPELKLELIKSLDPTLKKAYIVGQDIGSVLLNLVNNAYYALNKKWAKKIPDYKPTLEVITKDLDDHFEIKVRDNGIGIAADLQGKIFNPFFTTKPQGEGTGLGLSLSHNIIVKEHGGRFICDSKEGEYTEFTIILPFR